MSCACQTARVLGASSTGRWPIESMPPGTCWSSNQSTTKPHRLAAPARPFSAPGMETDSGERTLAQAGVSDSDVSPQARLRGLNWSQVAEPRITPRTSLQPPTARGGNMYAQ
jgi:hypothetical protein